MGVLGKASLISRPKAQACRSTHFKKKVHFLPLLIPNPYRPTTRPALAAANNTHTHTHNHTHRGFAQPRQQRRVWNPFTPKQARPNNPMPTFQLLPQGWMFPHQPDRNTNKGHPKVEPDQKDHLHTGIQVGNNIPNPPGLGPNPFNQHQHPHPSLEKREEPPQHQRKGRPIHLFLLLIVSPWHPSPQQQQQQPCDDGPLYRAPHPGEDEGYALAQGRMYAAARRPRPRLHPRPVPCTPEPVWPNEDDGWYLRRHRVLLLVLFLLLLMLV